MASSAEIINRRELKKKLAHPQSQLYLIDDLLIVAAANDKRTQGFLYALEYSQPGLPDKWQITLPAHYTTRFATFVPHHNLLIVSVSNWHTALNENSYLLALDVKTGQEVWRFPEQHELNNLSAPIFIKDKIFAVTNGKILLLPVENPGEPIWQPFPFTPHWFYNSIITDENRFYVSVRKGGVVGLAQGTGGWEKQYRPEEGEVRFAAALHHDTLIIGTTTGQLIAYDKTTTRQKWCVQVGNEITTGPLVHDPYVYVGAKDGTTHKILAVSSSNGQTTSTGFQPFTTASNRPFHAPLSLTPDYLLLCGANDGNLYALDAFTGQKEWQHSMQSELFSTPVIADNGQIIVGSRKGIINVLHSPPREIEKNAYVPIIEQFDRKSLLQFLRKHFNLRELKELCDFELNINPESFNTNSLDDFTHELITYCERHGHIKELVAKSRALRPHINW